MALKFLDLNLPPVVAVNCDNQKLWGMKRNGTQQGLKNQNINNIEFRKNAMTK